MDLIFKQRKTSKRAPIKKALHLVKENPSQKIEKIIYQGKAALSITYKSAIGLKNLTYIKNAVDFLCEKNLPFSRLICFENTKDGFKGIWSFKEGKIKSNWLVEDYKGLGNFLGKMHLFAKDYKESILYAPPIILALREEYETIRDFLPASFDSISYLLNKIEKKWPLFLPSGIVHTDLFPKNILFDGGKVSGILQNHQLQTDILLYDLTSIIKSIYFTNPENIREKEDAFFSSYSSFCPLIEEEFQAIPILTSAKLLHTAISLIKKHLYSIEFTNTHLNAAAISLIHAEKALYLYK